MLEALAAKFAGSLGAGLGNALGGDAGPFVGGSSQAAAYGTTLDGSGWAINFGGQQTATSSPSHTSTYPAATQPAMQASSSPLLSLAMLGAVLFAAFKGRA